MKLSELKSGETATISHINDENHLVSRLIDMGALSSPVTCLFKSLFGGIRAYRIQGSVIAIRQEDAQNINIVL